jgi:hypothetical protein
MPGGFNTPQGKKLHVIPYNNSEFCLEDCKSALKGQKQKDRATPYFTNR